MYTPQFSDFSTVSVRRLAWALQTSMTCTVNRMVKLLPAMFDRELVCRSCKDNTKCSLCAFKTGMSDSEKNSLLSI